MKFTEGPTWQAVCSAWQKASAVSALMSAKRPLT